MLVAHVHGAGMLVEPLKNGFFSGSTGSRKRGGGMLGGWAGVGSRVGTGGSGL